MSRRRSADFEMAASPAFRPEIEALRGVAASSVMVAHCFSMFDFFPRPGYLHGIQSYTNLLIHFVFDENAAVILFFMISGYVLGIQIDGIRGKPLGEILYQFYVRRFFRIAPPMWISAVMIYAVAFVITPQWHNPIYLLEAAAFFPRALPGPLWTVCVEMGCCLLFPLLYLIARKGWPSVILASIVTLYLLMQCGYVPEWARYLVFFQAGLLVGTVGEWVSQRNRAWLWIALAAYAAVPELAGAYGWTVNFSFRVAGGASFVILSYVVNAEAFISVLNHRTIRKAGRISYSLYLFHFIVMQTVGMIPWPSEIVARFPLALQAVDAVVIVSVSWWLADKMHALIEVPSNRLGRWVTGAANSRTTPSLVSVLPTRESDGGPTQRRRSA